MAEGKNKQQTILSLRRILEAGYELQEKRAVYRTPHIPKNNDPLFKSSKESFGEYVRQNWGENQYRDWDSSLQEQFTNADLNYQRFRSKTESNDHDKHESNAVKLKKRLSELDQIVNDPAYFDGYTLSPTNPVITYEAGVISQGYSSHRFRDQIYANLLSLLWQHREIRNNKGEVTKAGKPFSRQRLLKQLNIDNERFKDIVRSVHIEMRRKSIGLKIKYPKDVLIAVTQDNV